MSFLDTKHKKKSFTLTTILLSVLLLILFYFGLTYIDPPEESGIAINFGTMDFGSGQVQPKQPIKSIAEPVESVPQEEAIEEITEEAPSEAVAEEESTAESVTEEVLTQNNEEALRIKKQEEAKLRAKKAADRKRAEAERKERERKAAADKKRKEQEAKKKKLDALIGGIGKSEGQSSGSEGNDARAGDKGSSQGNPYASTYYGAPGSGSGGSGYGLNGRSLVNSGKVQQDCNEDGRVVVRIVVDKSGKVVKATPGVKGTTNNAPCLLEPARKTALMHKWNLDSKAPSQQIGFVVVNFKLGQ